MTKNRTKTILFASLIAAMILPFSSMNLADAEEFDKNPKDKTLDRLHEKEIRKQFLKKLNELGVEEADLKEKLDSVDNETEREKIIQRIDLIKSERTNMENENHKKNIQQTKLRELVYQQILFEKKLQNSNILEFVTTVGIDVTSKEIQVGLNQDTVNPKNIDSIVFAIGQFMPEDTPWHIVYSDAVTSLSCTQNECEPLIGGNWIEVVGDAPCSFGFKAIKDGVYGFITAGHCADGLVGNSVYDYSGTNIGTVSQERFDWGTSCDCAWITGSTSLYNNEVFDMPSTHTITQTTQASEQQNDLIMKTGAAGGISYGTVSAVNVSVYSVLDGYYVQNLVRSDVAMVHGDSGGTIVSASDKGNLYGIATAHDWWGNYHTPVDQIIAHMGVTPILN